MSKPAEATSLTTAKDRILIVDDEKENLEALRRLLRAQYEVVTTTSPFEALKLVQAQEFHVILSDQRMPEMTGVELLEKAKNVRPGTTRILLTGYTEIDSVIGAINRGHIYRYVAKPWDPEDLKLTLRQANEAFRLKREIEVKNEALERSNTELKQALDELRLLDRAKSRFLSLVSHELNTPVTVLQSFVAVLNDSKTALPADVKKAIQSLDEASLRLGEIVEEVLTYVRLASESQLILSPTELASETEVLKKELSAPLKEKKLRLEIGSGPGEKVSVDATKIRLALKKLLEDAIRRSPAGGTIEVEIKAKGKSVGYSVTRSGEPVSELAFRPLETDSSQMHHHRNLGLGLAICKLIVEAHRGEVMAKTGPGKRSTVTLMFHAR